MQDVVYDYICNWADFMRSHDVKGSAVNIIFMTYRYEDDPATSALNALSSTRSRARATQPQQAVSTRQRHHATPSASRFSAHSAVLHPDVRHQD